MAINAKISLWQDLLTPEKWADIFPEIKTTPPTPGKRSLDVVVRNGVAIRMKTIIVHQFMLGDSEDPELYIAEPLYHWEKSEQGTWVMENAEEAPYWTLGIDQVYSFCHVCRICARFSEKKLAEYYLRWGKTDLTKP